MRRTFAHCRCGALEESLIFAYVLCHRTEIQLFYARPVTVTRMWRGCCWREEQIMLCGIMWVPSQLWVNAGMPVCMHVDMGYALVN